MLSVVMAAYNEAAMLQATVHEVVDGLRSSGRPFELRIVENGSTDGTRTIAERLAGEIDEVRVHSMRAANYGEALRTGLLEATGDVAVIFDVDCYDLDFLKEALAALDAAPELTGPAIPTGPIPTGTVMVVGSKRAPGARDERPWLRRIATGTFAWILRWGFSLSVSDTHGMKVLLREPLDPMVRRCRFGADLFDTELILRAERAGFRVAEVPVTVSERRPPRTSVLRRVPRTLLGLLRLRLALAREGT